MWEAVRDARRASAADALAASELPDPRVPEEFGADLLELAAPARGRGARRARRTSRRAGAGCWRNGQAPEQFAARSARGYLSGLYGSQEFHRRECGLDPASIVQFLDRARSSRDVALLRSSTVESALA